MSMMSELNEIVSRIDDVLHDMPGVCDGCQRLKPTQPYSFDDGDKDLCADCTTNQPYVSMLYDQHVADMKQVQRDNDAKERRIEEND